MTERSASSARIRLRVRIALYQMHISEQCDFVFPKAVVRAIPAMGGWRDGLEIHGRTHVRVVDRNMVILMLLGTQ